MKRKVFLALALFALMAVGVYAQTEADFEVIKSKDGKSITIDEYKGKATAVNIPAKIQNLPVTEIGSKAFYANRSITSVTIPNGVTSIGKNAFEACINLTSVTIPNSITSIGNLAFRDCIRLTSVNFGGTIPSSGFVANAFGNLGDIRDKYLAAGGGAGTYTRPDGESTTWTKGGSATAAPAADGTPGLKFDLTPDKKGYIVSRGTFNQNSSANLVIPATYNNLPVTTIGNTAFNDCAIIPSVTIPASVTNIDLAAFSSCVNLRSVTFGGANTKFNDTEFPEGMDLKAKYKAGGAGTYTLSGKTWTKK